MYDNIQKINLIKLIKNNTRSISGGKISIMACGKISLSVNESEGAGT